MFCYFFSFSFSRAQCTDTPFGFGRQKARRATAWFLSSRRSHFRPDPTTRTPPVQKHQAIAFTQPCLHAATVRPHATHTARQGLSKYAPPSSLASAFKKTRQRGCRVTSMPSSAALSAYLAASTGVNPRQGGHLSVFMAAPWGDSET